LIDFNAAHLVHLWQINLEDSGDAVNQWRSLLSVDECRRADRFLRERDRLHFTVARGQLRSLLSPFLGVSAAEIQFEYTRRGKPSVLHRALNGSELMFNVSHSEGMALVVVACDRRVGVDLEYLRPMPDAEQLVRRFYTAQEGVEFSRLPETERIAAFFQGWTAKEAYLKATGEGVSHLRDVEFSLDPRQPLQLKQIFSPSECLQNWTVQTLVVLDGWMGAIAIEGKDWQLVHYAN
jgi:4'-phosphopantetheinyl transferase